MKTSRIPTDACPYCGHRLDAVTPIPENPEATPAVGDITVCLGCAGVLVFDEGLKVREPTKEEAYYAEGNPSVIHLRHAIRSIIRRRNKE